MLRLATSGLKWAAGITRSSPRMVGEPPEARWMTAAPASAAPTAASAISSGVIGRCGDMLGVWIAPVTAQVMMTLCFAMSSWSPWAFPCRDGGILRGRAGDDYPAGARHLRRTTGQGRAQDSHEFSLNPFAGQRDYSASSRP